MGQFTDQEDLLRENGGFFFLSNMVYRYVGLIFAALSVLQKNRRPFFWGEERGLISRTVVIEPNRYVDFLQV